MSDTFKKLVPIYLLLGLYLLVMILLYSTKIILYLSPIILLLIAGYTYYKTNNFKIRNRNKYGKSQNVIIIIIAYCLIYYLSGLLFGFLKNGYSLSIGSIIGNFFTYFSVILLKEYIRYRLISTDKSMFNLILITGIFILLDIELSWFTNGVSFLEVIFKNIVPITIINITSSYLVYRIGAISNFIYRGFLGGVTLFSPIIPNLNWLVNNLFLLILLCILMFSIDYLIALEDKRRRKRSVEKGNSFSTYLLFFFVVVFVLFVIGFFKYQPIAVLSDSMKSEFSRGDSVVIEKIEEKDLSTINVDDIIYYKYDGKYIIHRVVDITSMGNQYIFYTKGDNNPDIDNWEVKGYMVEGVVRLKIKNLGWPAVWLNEVV